MTNIEKHLSRHGVTGDRAKRLAKIIAKLPTVTAAVVENYAASIGRQDEDDFTQFETAFWVAYQTDATKQFRAG